MSFEEYKETYENLGPSHTNLISRSTLPEKPIETIQKKMKKGNCLQLKKKKSRRKGGGNMQNKRIVPDIPSFDFYTKEAMNILRGNIQMAGYNINVIALTSAKAHEGKSSI